MKAMKVIPVVLAVAVAVCLCLCSCAGVSVRKNNENLVQAQEGMPSAEVLALMGTPQLSELYRDADGREIQVLYYLTERDYPAAVSIRERCTPVVLVDGMLQGWGEPVRMQCLSVLR
jgi:hypothetical protein